jgi:glycosyltransferase involved in cell wall biosynthesis
LLIEILGAVSYKSIQKRGARKFSDANIFNLILNIGVNNPSIFILNSFLSLIISTLFLFTKRPNIVIISMPTGDIGLGALFACRLTRVKCIVDYRDEWEDYMLSLNSSKIRKAFYSFVKKLMASLYAKCNLTVAVTPNLLLRLKSRGVTKVKCIPNGADVNLFKPYDKKAVRRKLGLRKDDFIIVHSGGIGAYYRLDIVVRALAKLDASLRSKVKLLMVGYGPDLPKIMNMAKNLSLEDSMIYLGLKNDKRELAEILSAADVGLIPYDNSPLWKNSVPAKFYEYCACGIPVVATVHDDSHLGELIKRHEIGRTSPPLDEEKLANAIYWLYKNKSFRESAGKRARQLIEEKFDRNKIAERFLDLIRECV